MKQTPAISVKNLTIGYSDHVVASDISFTIERGEVVALLGRNGSGKSTLLKTLTRRLKPKRGEVDLNGWSLESLSIRQMAREVSLVVTDNGRDTFLTVRETVELGRHPYTDFLGSLKSEDKRIVEESMVATGCEKLAERRIDTLSDGERQKVSIARALAQDTPIMLLDEPFSFIDVASRLELLALLKRISREQQKSILFSTHDVAQAFRYSDRLLCFTTDGEIVCDTPKVLVGSSIPERLFESKGVAFNRKIMDYELSSDH